MRIRPALAALAVLAAGLIPSQAAVPDQGTLTPGTPLLTWAGEAPGGEINPLLLVSPVPELRCLVAECDTFKVTVALGAGYWAANPKGAVEFAIKWVYDGVIDLDLQVLDSSGTVIAQSAAVDSNAESVFVANLADGVYTARVIPSNTFNPDAEPGPVPYGGLVQVEVPVLDPPGQGEALLPNLRPTAPDGFHVSSALNLVPFPENPLLSCYAEETLQNPDHPTRCLRFNQTIANVGTGPLILRFGLAGIVTPGGKDNIIVQRIFSSDGSYVDTPLNETYQFHKVHAHLHYKGFGQSILYPWSEQGGRSETPISIGKKVGFCVIDVLLLDEYWGETGNGPRAHVFPFDCIVPDELDPAGPQMWVEQGVAVGWADVYGWNLADQYINITNVPDGIYEIVQKANPTSSVLETTAADNCSSTIIQLTGDVVTTPFGPGTATPCPA
ncbi:MAG: lysyl oxidase family protein [Actinomycetota bacterium]